MPGVVENHPECHLIVLLVDERPEEVTDFKRSVEAEIYASSNDEDIPSHIRVAELAIERAKRLVESGKDVVLPSTPLHDSPVPTIPPVEKVDVR